MPLLFDRLVSLASAFDDASFSPRTLAGRAADRFFDRRRARAAADPTWAAIEARRHGDGPGIRMLDADLTIADWHTQRHIERQLTPDPWWLAPVLVLSRLHRAHLAGRCQALAERARRGWSQQDLWSLDTVLCARLGAQLAALADVGCGWPDADEFPTADSWKQALRTQAHALLRYGRGAPEAAAATDAWYALAAGADSPEREEEAAAALAHLADVDEDVADAARAALHWVADHLGMLWY